MRKSYLFLILAIVLTVNAVAQNIPNYLPKDGLVAWYPFNGNANDESGNGNHGTVNGATLSADRNGVENSAYSFNGINNNIVTNRTNTNNFTISIWTKINKLVEYTPFIDAYFETWELVSDSKGEFLDFVNWQVGSYTDYITNYKLDTNKWFQITLVKNDKSIKLYINGNLITSIDNIIFPNEDKGSFIFGNSHSGADQWLDGQLDDIAIYNRALNEQEIYQLYAGCTKETASSSSFNSLLFTNGNSITVTAEPQGGVFTGTSIENNLFIPAKAKIGSNKVKYNFKNSQGCADSTIFTMVVADTVGTSCTKFDTVIVNKTKYDTVIVKTNVFDTVKVNKTIYDTITIKNIINDTVKVNKYDTITVTNNITKYDTVIVNKTNYDTVSILKIKFKLTTGLSANQLSSLSIFPNPTSDILHIETTDAKALDGYRYRILDALGKEVYNELVTQTTTEIPLKTLGAAGIYQFEVLDAKNVSIQSNKIVLY